MPLEQSLLLKKEGGLHNMKSPSPVKGGIKGEIFRFIQFFEFPL
jgi:hypothetical protein